MNSKIFCFIGVAISLYAQDVRIFVKLTNSQYEAAQGIRFGGIANARDLFPNDNRFRSVCPAASRFEWLVSHADLKKWDLERSEIARIAVVSASVDIPNVCGPALVRPIYEVSTQTHSLSNSEVGQLDQSRLFKEIGFDSAPLSRVANSDLALVFLDGKISPHEDLPLLSVNFSFGNTESEFHGTAVAGVAIAVSGNGRGIDGIVQDIPVVSLEVFRQVVAGGQKVVTTDEVAVMRAIVSLRSIPQNFIIANMSFAIFESQEDRDKWDIWKDIVSSVRDNILLISAAGNGNFSASSNQPCRAVSNGAGICVGGVDSRHDVAGNYGQSVNILAPWDAISTLPNDRYALVEGTSISSSIISAVAAEITKRLITEIPNASLYLRADYVKKSLLAGTKFVPKAIGKVGVPGIVNVEKSYHCLKNLLHGHGIKIAPLRIYGVRENYFGSLDFGLGDYVSIFGENIVSAVGSKEEVAIFLNEKPLEVLYASPMQINVRLPQSVFGWKEKNNLSIVRVKDGIVLAHTATVIKTNFSF